MMVRHLIVVAFLVLAAPPHTSGQEIGVESSRKSLRQHSWYFNYPGGMLFHTAFNHTLTTRYILLKETKQCSSLEQYLELDANQMDVIKKLRPLRVEKPPGTGATDPNAQPDEHVLDSNYLSFLRPEQLDRLDLVAFRFDGYAAITRASMAARVDLSDESKGNAHRVGDGAGFHFAASLAPTG
jgi:hypothetical protein